MRTATSKHPTMGGGCASVRSWNRAAAAIVAASGSRHVRPRSERRSEQIRRMNVAVQSATCMWFSVRERQPRSAICSRPIIIRRSMTKCAGSKIERSNATPSNDRPRAPRPRTMNRVCWASVGSRMKEAAPVLGCVEWSADRPSGKTQDTAGDLHAQRRIGRLYESSKLLP